MHRYFTYKKSTLHYTRQGTGEKALFCFHGYGWNCYNFDFIMPLLVTRYTVFSFDLFFHGESEWNEPSEPTKEDLKNIFCGIMEAEKVVRFSLMGYSMGGRWSTTLLLLFPDKTESMFLIAADGLWRHPLFRNLTSLRPDNPLVRFIISRSTWLFVLMRWMRKAGWVDSVSYNFFFDKVNSKDKRSLLIQRWRNQKYMTVDPAEIVELIHTFHIPVHLFYGLHDHLIPIKEAHRFEQLASREMVYEINEGHMLIISAAFYNTLEKVLNTSQ